VLTLASAIKLFSLIAIDIDNGGSHDTAKIIVIVFAPLSRVNVEHPTPR
jgi:hypothetical protein